MTIKFVILASRQGKVRLMRFYTPVNIDERGKLAREVVSQVIARSLKMCNVLEFREYKLIYKRYASLYFIFGVGPDDNELISLETIHMFVEVLDRYFGNVCELDLIFHFHKAYYILDEMLMAGEMQETSRRNSLRYLMAQDQLSDAANEGKPET